MSQQRTPSVIRAAGDVSNPAARHSNLTLRTVDQLTKVLARYGLNLADLVENGQAACASASRWRSPPTARTIAAGE
jgi:hypothetical protein